MAANVTSSSSGSSRFTEDEILEGLLEQGVVPSRELVAELKKGKFKTQFYVHNY